MIGIIGAMDEEVAALKESMETEAAVERAGMTFFRGKLGGRDSCIGVSGGCFD